jgi:hypothetical protein
MNTEDDYYDGDMSDEEYRQSAGKNWADLAEYAICG